MITKRGQWHKHPKKEGGFMFAAIHVSDKNKSWYAQFVAEVVPDDGKWRVNAPPVPDFANEGEMHVWIKENGDWWTATSSTLKDAIRHAYNMCKMDVPEPVTVEITGEPSEESPV